MINFDKLYNSKEDEENLRPYLDKCVELFMERKAGIFGAKFPDKEVRSIVGTAFACGVNAARKVDNT